MGLCKDCFHREVCESWTTINLDDIPPEIPCGHFKDTASVAPRAEWISVKERLPEEGKYVIVWVGSAQVARIEKGITEEERQKMKNGEIEDRIEYGWSQSTGFMPLKKSDLYKSCDVFGNNLVPYCWKANGGPMEWFGQNVTHWMPLPEPPKES